MSVNEKTGKCKGSAFALVPDYVQKEIPKLNGITLENRIIFMKMQLLREEIRKICKKILNVLLQLPKNIQTIRMYSAPQNFQLEWKTTLQLFDPKKRKNLVMCDSHLNKIRKDKFKESLPNARVYVKSFSGENTNQLD